MVDFSTIYFGKAIHQLEIDDIIFFFSMDRVETISLEFKSGPPTFSDQHLSAVIKTSCALLNSSGGLIIWGSPKEDKDRHGKSVYKGNLTGVHIDFEKDQLVNKITSQITPAPTGIRIQKLSIDQGRFLYIFEVQESHGKPHQHNNQYPIRIDGQNIPAPHYFIEAMFKRITYPKVECYLRFVRARFRKDTKSFVIDIEIALFNFSPLIHEENIVFELYTSPGYFRDLGAKDDEFRVSGKEPLLTFGRVIKHNVALYIPADQPNMSITIKLILMVVGLKAPTISSIYTLDTGKIQEGIIEKPDDIVIGMRENEYVHDTQNRLGTTRKDVLKDYLEREID